MTNVAVLGISGRVGRCLVRAIRESPDLVLSGALASPSTDRPSVMEVIALVELAAGGGGVKPWRQSLRCEVEDALTEKLAGEPFSAWLERTGA